MTIEPISLAGKRVLVTGGTTGIGRAIVALLAQEGARIVTFGRHEPELCDALAHTHQIAPDAEVHGLIADVATREGVAKVFAEADDRLGGLDILVNNAGISAETVQDSSEDDWRYAIETDLVGYLACSQAALKRMEGHAGHIVFIGSISGENLAPGTSVYAAAKAGVHAYAATLRKEVQEKNIRVTMIEPGSVGADMQEMSPQAQQAKIDKHEMLYAEELADSVVFALTRPERTDIAVMRVEPRLQKQS